MNNNVGNNSPPPPYSYSSAGEMSQKTQPNFANSDNFSQFNSTTAPPYPTSPSPTNNQPPTITIGSNQPPVYPTRVVARTALIGPFPVEMDCPYCHVIFSKFKKLTKK